MKAINKRTTFKKTTIALAIISLFTVQPVLAKPVVKHQTSTIKTQKDKNNENIGFGTGMVLGAIVAGPIGAMVTSIVGIFTAKHINVINDKEQLTMALSTEKKQTPISVKSISAKASNSGTRIST